MWFPRRRILTELSMLFWFFEKLYTLYIKELHLLPSPVPPATFVQKSSHWQKAYMYHKHKSVHGTPFHIVNFTLVETWTHNWLGETEVAPAVIMSKGSWMQILPNDVQNFSCTWKYSDKILVERCGENVFGKISVGGWNFSSFNFLYWLMIYMVLVQYMCVS